MEPIVNMHIMTNEVRLKSNGLTGENFQIKPRFTRDIKQLDDTHWAASLRVEIMNTEENPFPVEIIVDMTGLFDVSRLDKKDIQSFMKIQTLQLMLPHIRNIIANLTTAALMNPLMLPIYDARKLFPDE